MGQVVCEAGLILTQATTSRGLECQALSRVFWKRGRTCWYQLMKAGCLITGNV